MNEWPPPPGLGAMLIADHGTYEVYDIMIGGYTIGRYDLAKGDPEASELYVKRLPIPAGCGNLEFGRRRPCCEFHDRNCEPPSELCCRECIERDHPGHRWIGPCSVPDLTLHRAVTPLRAPRR